MGIQLASIICLVSVIDESKFQQVEYDLENEETTETEVFYEGDFVSTELDLMNVVGWEPVCFGENCEQVHTTLVTINISGEETSLLIDSTVEEFSEMYSMFFDTEETEEEILEENHLSLVA